MFANHNYFFCLSLCFILFVVSNILVLHTYIHIYIYNIYIILSDLPFYGKMLFRVFNARNLFSHRELQFVRAPVSTMCVGQACSMGSLLLAAGTKGNFYYSLCHSTLFLFCLLCFSIFLLSLFLSFLLPFFSLSLFLSPFSSLSLCLFLFLFFCFLHIFTHVLIILPQATVPRCPTRVSWFISQAAAPM